MIREYKKEDLLSIDKIGSLIHDDFLNTYDIENNVSLDYVHIYVYEDEEVFGFIQIEEHFEITDIINIAVLPSEQGNGIASALIQYVLNNTNSEKILLEVRETNDKAINLYKKMGFIEINRRHNYYGNEDAIIMERSI